MFPELETKRLILRKIVEDDAGEILECFSDEEVLRYYGQKPLESINQVMEIIKNFSKGYEEKQLIKWGIQLKGKEKLIGTIGFQEWSPGHKKANVSYALFPEYWNKGYATEAVHEAISYGFNELQYNRIGAIVFTQNSGSIALLSKLGFKKEGTLREYLLQNGIPFDTYVYSLLREEAKI
ncbi:GNAT family protein [Priestia megaterium]|uniref:GNAT family N-acetyltransferase n=1 Tax=Priestia megaterium TaxID=1404 RepID=UPI000BF974D1|nr:GNAT family protein [Priestia megaterium]MCM3153987.1 GNAT family N-acetyltransferase [Priestia megaterium]MDC7769130.1 GNAT family protein [Priestia megaterium]PFQ78806.1 GNAT family N-acetyltransferase [Priestia megaterium]PFW48133.1 GNAT family N-acetyltransferase [Priestia megaterium]